MTLALSLLNERRFSLSLGVCLVLYWDQYFVKLLLDVIKVPIVDDLAEAEDPSRRVLLFLRCVTTGYRNDLLRVDEVEIADVPRLIVFGACDKELLLIEELLAELT